MQEIKKKISSVKNNPVITTMEEGSVSAAISEVKTEKIALTGKVLLETSRNFENLSRSNTFFILGALIGIILCISLAQYYLIGYVLAPFVCLFAGLVFKLMESWFQSPTVRRLNTLKVAMGEYKREINDPTNDQSIKGVYINHSIETLEEIHNLTLPKRK